MCLIYTFFITMTLYAICYLYLMKPLKAKMMTPEQKLFYGLVVFNFLLNDPFIGFNIYYSSWFWVVLCQLFITSYVTYLLYIFTFTLQRTCENVGTRTQINSMKKIIYFAAFGVVTFTLYIQSFIEIDSHPGVVIT